MKTLALIDRVYMGGVIYVLLISHFTRLEDFFLNLHVRFCHCRVVSRKQSAEKKSKSDFVLIVFLMLAYKYLF